jgi:hypothetical protein
MAWWKKALATLSLLAIWSCGLILIGGYGYESQYFWFSGCALSIGVAAAPFWYLRSSSWYWPTIAVLALIHLGFLYFERQFISNRDLPSKGLVQGMFVIDCMASWGIMVAVCRIVTQRFPWRLSDE